MSKYDVVFHVDKADGSLNVAFSNAANYAAALPGESFAMVLVVNSKAVTQLTRGNADILPGLEKAHGLGLAVRVCQNALNATGTAPESLFPQCVVVPAGIVELVNLQREGYAYIKP